MADLIVMSSAVVSPVGLSPPVPTTTSIVSPFFDGHGLGELLLAAVSVEVEEAVEERLALVEDVDVGRGHAVDDDVA